MGFWNRSWSIIYWLPTGIFLSHSIYNIKVISGPSMQVGSSISSIPSAQNVLESQPSILTLLPGETLRYSIVSQSIPLDIIDVMILLPFENPNRMLVKRILALEGDVVKTLPPYPDQDIVVPQGHVWVEGDEPFFSDDSNRFGAVPRALLESKLVIIIWPPSRFGPVNRPEFPPNGYGQANRLAMTQLERERARHSRVTIQS